MIYKKWQRYSYTAQRHQRHRILLALSWIIGVFFLYLLISSYLVFSFRIESNSMEKALTAGDIGLALSTRLFPKDEESSWFPYKRGSLVVLEKSFTTERQSWFIRLWDNVIDFFTAQQTNASEDPKRLFVKRVIALPGDEISIVNNVVRIKPAKQNYTLTEFELSGVAYDIVVPENTAAAGEELPFSAQFGPLRLNEGECFVLSDDRRDCNDSRTWGPVPIADLRGKPIFRYWPFSRIGKL
ncbi:MAG: signal peptidase I [Treponema sp.]|nr:signal peptidase I [Treponema sp.]